MRLIGPFSKTIQKGLTRKMKKTAEVELQNGVHAFHHSAKIFKNAGNFTHL